MSRILLGVTGGIAAYKSAELVRLFIRNSHEVKVVMTDGAERFIGPLTFEALTKNPVMRPGFEPSPISHIEYGTWADICVIAPATANIIGKLAGGIADDPLTSAALALSCPLLIAPAMNFRMYAHPAVKSNLEILKNRGVISVGPRRGGLACGEEGEGRMEEPSEIAAAVETILKNQLSGSEKKNAYEKETPEKREKKLENSGNPARKPLEGLNILVTAGPTREYIDPVRYITNRSSGKMGYAIAEAALDMGAYVTLISGDVSLNSSLSGVVRAETAEEMFEAVKKFSVDADIIIMAAAVADFVPKEKAAEKIKKKADVMTLELVKTKDILAYLGKNGKPCQVVAGFAAETENLEENALKKLEAKNLDMIAANDVSKKDTGFDSDYNELKLFFKDGRREETGKCLKTHAARIILAECAVIFNEKAAGEGAKKNLNS